MSGSKDTFFVSDTLTGRLTESNLADQSEEYKDLEDVQFDEGLLECVLEFEDAMISCSVVSIETSPNSIEALSVLVSLDVDSVARLLLNNVLLETVNFYDSEREKIAEFDTREKMYNAVITKAQESENYRVSLIFN